MHEGVGKRQYAPPLKNHWSRYDSVESRFSDDRHAWDVRGQYTLSLDEPSDIGRVSWRLRDHPAPVALREGRLIRWDFPKLGYSVVRPPTQSYAWVRRRHVAEALERYISFWYQQTKVRFYTLWVICAYALYARVTWERERIQLEFSCEPSEHGVCGVLIRRCTVFSASTELSVKVQTATRAPFVLFVLGIHSGKGGDLERRWRSPWYAAWSYARRTIWTTGRNML